MVLEPIADTYLAGQANVIGPVLSVEDVQTTLVAEVRYLQSRAVQPSAAEKPEPVPVSPAWRPVNLMSTPEQPVRSDRPPDIMHPVGSTMRVQTFLRGGGRLRKPEAEGPLPSS